MENRMPKATAKAPGRNPPRAALPAAARKNVK